MRRFAPQKTSGNAGVTLVELLISLALIAFISLSIAFFLLKSTVATSSLQDRFHENAEIQLWLQDLQNDFQQGAYISANSHNARLEYTTYDPSGAVVKKIYRIVTIASKQYL